MVARNRKRVSEPPLRVLHVVEAMTGGTRRFVLDIAGGLPADRFVQHVVLSLRRCPSPREDLEALREAGAEVTVVNMVRNISPARDLQALGALRRVVRQWRPDIVHGHSSKGGFLARAAVSYCGLQRRPVTLYSPHCFAFQAPFSAPRRWLYRALERRAAAWTDRFVLISEGEQRAAVRARVCDPAKIVRLNLGVDVQRFSHTIRASRPHLGLPQGLLVGSVAGLRPQKRADLLVRAFAAVADRFPSARLVFVGDGPMQGALERLARRAGIGNRVAFLGFRPDVPDILPQLDVFALSSAWEGMPYALLEAMASGVLTVAPALEGVADVVEAAECGVLFTPLRASSLAAALAVVLAAPAHQRQTWGIRGRDYVVRHHSLPAMLEALARIYEDAVQQH